jgi:hypothetical protein
MFVIDNIKILLYTEDEDEDRDGLRNVGFLTTQPLDPADSPRKLHHS